MSITDLSAVELRRQIKQKELSPVEVVKAYLDRIEKFNSKWNAYVTINEHAIDEAKNAEEAVMKGEELGGLHGIPVAIKDLTPTKGILTTYGSEMFKDFIPDYDATFLQRIKEAGGIVLGKTNTPEFGHKGTTDNPLFGTTKNPWNEKLTPGGSSGGSAVAVAAKLAPFAEGSDGGGSIRIPSSLTGIFGLKPTFGVVPHDSDPNNLFGSQHPYLHNGPMARTVEDAALLFSVMMGYQVNDPDSVPTSAVDFADLNGDVKGLKIAYTLNYGLYEVSDDVREVVEKACDNLASLGCEVEEVNLDLGISKKDLARAFSGMWCVKYAANYGHLYDKAPENFSENIAKMIAVGRKLSAVDYRAIEFNRTKVWKAIQSILNKYQFIVSPTLATTAFEHHLPGPSHINGKNINPESDWMMTQIYNLTGHPAASLPIGLTSSRLPVGLQVVGSRFADRLVLQLCRNYEKAFETYIEPTYE
ncbi:amidase [Pueribacillus theae]|uniref:amidase n=1 Tax=Pueribacillus theae TaxID=2171751 RepID=UPI001401C891|nr:amidase [Pueribacillus theae]